MLRKQQFCHILEVEKKKEENKKKKKAIGLFIVPRLLEIFYYFLNDSEYSNSLILQIYLLFARLSSGS